MVKYPRDLEKKAIYNKEYRVGKEAQLKISRRRNFLKSEYGITIDQFNELLAKQNGCCAICLRHYSELDRSLAVDHRHGGPRKGEITGLLCTHCNHRIVGRHNDPEMLERAAAYLRQGTGWFVPIKGRRTYKKKIKT